MTKDTTLSKTNEDFHFIPYSSTRDGNWRTSTNNNEQNIKSRYRYYKENENTNDKNKRKLNNKKSHQEYGLDPKRFHSLSHYEHNQRESKDSNNYTLHSSESKKVLDKETKIILQQARKRVGFNQLKKRFDNFKCNTEFKNWPIQQPALEHLDEMIKSRNERKLDPMNYKQDIDHGIDMNDIESPLWSTEPKIFAVETSSTGKRKYLVCQLGRFMHHYWRFCEPCARHHYELIREDTPCRLYFGKNGPTLLIN